jgi:hypothetical protein
VLTSRCDVSSIVLLGDNMTELEHAAGGGGDVEGPEAVGVDCTVVAEALLWGAFWKAAGA